MEDEAQRRERERVLSEYGTWRITADEDAPAAAEVRDLETLLRLKADHLDSPEPGLWTKELTTALLTEVMPRTVIQSREQVMDMVPTLGRFFTYLRETGRWHPGSMEAGAGRAMLADLEFTVLEAADDPSRRSFSTNILGYGLSLGVDLEDDRELAGFLHWYSALPDQERLVLSDTGRLPSPSVPYEREAAARSAGADDLPGGSWPWFLPAPEEDGMALGGLDAEQDAPAYARNAFVQRAVALLDFVGEGRRVTRTGALGREDSRDLLAAMGEGGAVRSMWDRPEIVGPWVSLLDGGWLELDRGMVRRAAGPVPAPSAQQDAEGFVAFGHAVLTAALFGRDARDAEDGGFAGMPDTIAALLAACGTDGLTLPDPLSPEPGAPRPPQDPLTGVVDREELTRLFAVGRDLSDLAAIGVLERRGSRFLGSPAVLVALVALIRGRDEG
jgi:hypothetical protein